MKNIINQATTSALKAVPLAVMLAMSPLTPNNAKNIMRGEKEAAPIELVQNQQKNIPNIYKTKEVEYENGLVLTYKYIDKNSDLSNFEWLSIVDNRVVGYDYLKVYDEFGYDELCLGPIYSINRGLVHSLNKYAFDVIGSDGRSYGTWNYEQLLLYDGFLQNSEKYKLSHPKIIEDVLKDMNTPNNNTCFKVENITRPLYPGYGGGLSSYREPDLSWIQKVKDTPCNFGNVCFVAEVQTQVGKYDIVAFSNDSDNANYETLIFKRDDGVKFKLDGLRQLDITIETDEQYKENVLLNAIDISWPNVGKFSIYDDELFNALLDMAQKDKDNNNAIPVSVETVDCTVSASGTFGNKSNKIERIL